MAMRDAARSLSLVNQVCFYYRLWPAISLSHSRSCHFTVPPESAEQLNAGNCSPWVAPGAYANPAVHEKPTAEQLPDVFPPYSSATLQPTARSTACTSFDAMLQLVPET